MPAGTRLLAPVRQVLDRDLVCVDLVRSKHQREARADLVRVLELPRQLVRLRVNGHTQAGLPQIGRKLKGSRNCCAASKTVTRIEAGKTARSLGKQTVFLQQQGHHHVPHGKADSRQPGTAHVGEQVVVAAATQERRRMSPPTSQASKTVPV